MCSDLRIFALPKVLSQMKKIALLVFSAVLVAIASCTKENASESTFAGIEVEVGEQNGSYSRLYVLNEGAYPGMSTLDVIDFKNTLCESSRFVEDNRIDL